MIYLISKKLCWPLGIEIQTKIQSSTVSICILYIKLAHNYVIPLFRSPEPKAHRWAYSIGRHPSVVRPSTFSNDISSEAQNPIRTKFQYSIYRPGEQIIVFFVPIGLELWLLWQLIVAIDLQWEKWKLAFIAISLQIFWQKFCRNVPWVTLYQQYEFCPNCWIWLVAMATETLNLWKKYSKIFSEAIRGMKLKLCRNVHNISLYKKYDFYCCCSCAFIAVAT